MAHPGCLLWRLRGAILDNLTVLSGIVAAHPRYRKQGGGGVSTSYMGRAGGVGGIPRACMKNKIIHEIFLKHFVVRMSDDVNNIMQQRYCKSFLRAFGGALAQTMKK